MKTILRVAKAELRTLFFSPIAWFLLIVFLIQCGVTYFGSLNGFAKAQELGGMRAQYLTNLTEYIFLSRSGLFGSVMQNLYLYIPLLTMSLISRETASGTIRLLYSSPIKVREIIFGKYLAMMIYSLLLVAIVGIFVVSGIYQVQHAQTGMLMTALLGFYLLLCAYSAIGLFMSCLTTYQVVAAICTFVTIGILSYIGTLWQRVEFVRELTYFLSINGRTQKMLQGLVTSKDVIYFLVIVYIFLGLSIYKLRGGMESKPAMVKAGRYAVLIASALLIGYISSMPGLIGYYDATVNKEMTLTPNAQKVLADLGDDPLEVTAYNNMLGRFWFLGSPESYNQNLSAWEPYMRFKNNIQLKKTVTYYDSTWDSNNFQLRGYPGKTLKEIAEQYAKNNDIKLSSIKTPEEIHKIIDLRPELNRYVMQLKWKGKTTMLRVFDDQQMWPSETEVSAALKRLQQVKLPKIAFLTGNLERDINKGGDRDYETLTNLSVFRNSLVNQGFDVDTVSLETQDVPADISTLVVADPKVALSGAVMGRLQQYIDRGGNLLIAGEPGKQSLLNPLLKQLGVQLMDGLLIQESKDLAPDLVAPDLTRMAGTFTKALEKKAADSQKVSMPGAAGLSFSTGGAFAIQPLLMTDAKLSWNRIKPLDKDLMTSAVAADESAPSMTVIPVSNKVAVVNTVAGKAGVIKAPVVTKSIAPANNTADKADAGHTGTPSMEEKQKKALALQNALNEVMKGPGTQEEKQQKAQEMIANANKEAEDVMTPEMKKRSDSVRGLIIDIMKGPGTPEEKRQKTLDLMANLRKARAASEAGSGSASSSAVAAAGKTASASSSMSVQKVVAGVAVAPVVSGGASVMTGGASVMMSRSGQPSGGKKNVAAGTVTFSAADGDIRGPIPTVLSLTRKVNGKEQRIVVAGDADFMSNAELSRFNLRTANFVFNTALFSWLSNGEFPIDTSRPDPKDKRVNVTPDQVDILRILFVWVLPGILLAFAAVLLIRRKRR